MCFYKFNQIDTNTKKDRRHFVDNVLTSIDFVTIERNDTKYRIPLNPRGNVGLWGRGELGCFGPNHAADPVVLRRRPGSDRMTEIVLIKRSDSHMWALPGGMVEAGSDMSNTCVNEFAEEAMDSNNMKDVDVAIVKQDIRDKFKAASAEYPPVYKGQVFDDPRNTNCAWMETTVQVFYDKDDTLGFQNWNLKAGDDAIGVRWFSVNDLPKNLYANHMQYINMALNQVMEK